MEPAPTEHSNNLKLLSKCNKKIAFLSSTLDSTHNSERSNYSQSMKEAFKNNLNNRSGPWPLVLFCSCENNYCSAP